jgi:hypothetical protein
MNEDLLFGQPIDAYGGAESMKEIIELKKALSVGYAMGTTDQLGFGAVRVESLEDTVKSLVANETTAAFFVALKKSKAKSTVEEYPVINEIGDAGFYVEGGLPEEFDEDLRREFEQVKYMGAVGQIPIPATIVQSVVDNMATIVKLKATAILRKADLKTFFGNSNNVSLEWNGYLEQFLRKVKNPTQNIIDLRGKRLRPEVLNQIGTIVMDNYGNPNNLKGWISPEVYQNYTDELIVNKTLMVGNNQVNSIIANPAKWELGSSKGSLERDIYLKSKGQTYYEREYPKLNTAGNAFAATSLKAPATLNGVTCTLAVAGTGSKMDAGTYDYAVLPINKYGAGAAFAIAGTIVTAGQIVTFTLADNGSASGSEATAFEIYRKLTSASGLTSYRFLKTVSATGAKVDDGEEIPGTKYGFFFDWDMNQVLDFKQLLPMVKMNLAVVSDSYRWLQKLYGTPILYNANKMVLVKNIGTTAWA